MYMYNVVIIVQNVLKKIFMPSVVIQALKKSVMFFCTPFSNRRLIYSDRVLKSPCIAHQPDGIHPVQIHLMWIGIHLITAVSVTKRLSLYESTLWS